MFENRHAEKTIPQQIGHFLSQSMRGIADTMHAPKFKAQGDDAQRNQTLGADEVAA